MDNAASYTQYFLSNSPHVSLFRCCVALFQFKVSMKVKYLGLCGYCLRRQRFFTDIRYDSSDTVCAFWEACNMKNNVKKAK
ncbi:hypothetical protein T07_12558 [Trichinella nelsoni]|uniref:Uncharacterized protein n=1 Tax=Trichinella nelsoni TaxID=6336 RepID=A0A0V0RRM9_9BILA|nr:hypothetical protein T07_12558 [Trichinella nelsoni]